MTELSDLKQRLWACAEVLRGSAVEVKKALRSTLFKYRLHQDADLFNRSYRYIRQYY